MPLSAPDSDSGKKIVVFLDSFGHGDLEHTDWINEHCFDGRLDAGTPFVTPKVLGEIYTGKNPGVHGLPAVSRFDTAPRGRPAVATLPELAAEADSGGSGGDGFDRVMQYHLPFIHPPDVTPGDTDYLAISSAMGQQSAIPRDQGGLLNQPGPAGDISQPDEDHDVAFDLRVDHTEQLFGAARNLLQARDLDCVFISYRLLDSYCHWDYLKPAGPGEGRTYRDRLLVKVDQEVARLSNYGDVLVFGDHGARKMTDVFRINRWLMQQGYLDVDLDLDFLEQARAYGVLDEPTGPGESLSTSTPGVEVNESESVAICDDPFSCGLTLLEGAVPATVENLVADLRGHDAIEDVMLTGATESVQALHDWTGETPGIGETVLTHSLEWEGPHLDECPDLYPRRAPGVFVSGNFHPDPGGAEVTRSGVHHPIGNWGATAWAESPGPVPDEPIDPRELFHLIGQAFLGLDPADLERDHQATTDARVDQGAARDRLEDLGYL